MIRVLIVDDSEINFMVLESMISIYNTDVTHAQDLAQAQKALSTDAFDVVVLDIYLENELGTDLFNSYEHPKASITYLSCSAEFPSDNQHFFAHIAKPFEPAQVEDIFSSIIARSDTPVAKPSAQSDDLRTQFLGAYVSETLELIQTAKSLLDNQELENCRKLAHRLQGSSALIAADKELQQGINDFQMILKSPSKPQVTVPIAKSILVKLENLVGQLKE